MQIYISRAFDDREAAEALRRVLEKARLPAFFREEFSARELSREAIITGAIRRSELILFFLSQASEQSTILPKELKIASDCHRPILFVWRERSPAAERKLKEIVIPDDEMIWAESDPAVGELIRLARALVAPTAYKGSYREIALENGDRFEGWIINGKKNGWGIYRWKSGDVYEGFFQNGEITGHGKKIFQNNNEYEGDFENGLFHGRGTFRWADGNVYEGEFLAGKRQGKGLYSSADGSRYAGEFLENQRHGEGVFTLPDGKVYTGSFRRGNPFCGKLCAPDGSVIAIYENGKKAILKEDFSMNDTDLILFAGQSNMQGQTEALPADNRPVEGAWEYRYATDSLVPLCHPVGEDLDTEGKLFTPDRSDLRAMLQKAALLSSCMGNANMVPAFCRSYCQATGRTAVAVHVAKGSTTVSYWQKGQIGYEIFVKKAKAAIEKVKPARVLLAWLQGESDALAGTSKEEYARLLTQLKNDLKNELSLECFGILLVGRFAGDARDDAVIDAQRELCRNDGDFLLLTDRTHAIWNEPRYMNPFVKGHFSCEGQEHLGTHAGTALGNYVNPKE